MIKNYCYYFSGINNTINIIQLMKIITFINEVRWLRGFFTVFTTARCGVQFFAVADFFSLEISSLI